MTVVGSTFVEDVTELWRSVELESAHKLVRSTERRLPDNSKAVIEVETAGALALIEVWERENCLDVSVLRNGEQEVKILAAGMCEGNVEVIGASRSFEPCW